MAAAETAVQQSWNCRRHSSSSNADGSSSSRLLIAATAGSRIGPAASAPCEHTCSTAGVVYCWGVAKDGTAGAAAQWLVNWMAAP